MSTVMTTRGTIIKTPDATPGLVIVNGAQKSFTLEGVWRSPVAPAPNMTVDVEVDGGGSVVGISAVDSQQLAKEKLDRFSGIAQQQGKEAADIARQGVGALASRMGTAALVATVIVWVAWFFLPFVKIEFFLLNRTLTYWDFLALDMTNPQSPTGSRGLLGLLGMLCLVAPVARPFIQHARARFLNAAPLAFILLGYLLVYLRFSGGAGDVDENATLAEMAAGIQREAAKALLESMSISAAAVVLVGAAGYLAFLGLREKRT
jgi:hypothetical protein